MEAQTGLGRRLRAARELAGMRSTDALAAKIGEPGLGTKTLRAFERGEKQPRPRDLAAIAQACGVGRAYFSAPEEALRNPEEEQGALAQRLAGLDERLGRIEAALLADDRRAALSDLADAADPPARDAEASPRPARARRGRRRPAAG